MGFSVFKLCKKWGKSQNTENPVPLLSLLLDLMETLAMQAIKATSDASSIK